MTDKSRPESESSGMDASERRRPESPSIMKQEDSQIDLVRPQETFSIATPVVTNTSQIEDSLNDGTFLHSASSYNQQLADGRYQISQQFRARDDTLRQISKEAYKGSSVSMPTKSDVAKEVEIDNEDHNTTIGQDQLQTQADLGKDNQLGDPTTFKKKKGARKVAKLDTKSKLEKSRQSARECRARKKLRYQYLEDLVCNREKAVVKLREELSMFCEMSRRVDDGTLSDKDRHLLIEQTKENSKS